MMRKILSASPLLRVAGVVVACVAVGLVLLSVVRQTRGSSLDVSSAVQQTWQGYKTRLIFCGPPCGNNLGLVFDPSASYKARSEGVGYGLLMAALINDHQTFDTILDAADKTLYDSTIGLYNWEANASGDVSGTGAATDADEDIALALIFAQKHVDNHQWTQRTGSTYGDKASALIDAIYQHEVSSDQYLLPGNQWSTDGKTITNPSYFAPAAYRTFDAFQGTDRWKPVIDHGYETLFGSRGAAMGLAPDWSQSDGNPAYPYCDANGRSRDDCRYDMTYEGIRIPWRIGLDCLWYGTDHACEWVKREADFLLHNVGHGDPEQAAAGAVMFNVGGVPVAQQSEGMVAMWLAGVTAAGNSDLQSALMNRLLNTFGQNITGGQFWGADADRWRDYYNQSLAWLGASVAAGLWDQFKP
jgi:endo-1,4-beta-D-glucanase Y